MRAHVPSRKFREGGQCGFSDLLYWSRTFLENGDFEMWRRTLEVDGIAEADDTGANDSDVRFACEFGSIVGIE